MIIKKPKFVGFVKLVMNDLSVKSLINKRSKHILLLAQIQLCKPN